MSSFLILWAFSKVGIQSAGHSVRWAFSQLGISLGWAFDQLGIRLAGHSVSWAFSPWSTYLKMDLKSDFFLLFSTYMFLKS